MESKKPPSKASIGSTESWKKYTIYRVPALLKDRNPQAYSPQLVSIGPYHHGAPHLQSMEEHKARALGHFLERSNLIYENCYEAIHSCVTELMESYQQLGEEWMGDRERFVRLMVVDGCFLLEFMRGFAFGWDYETKDPIFSLSALVIKLAPVVVQDILMLENQMPLLVIERLIAVEAGWFSEKNHDKVCRIVTGFLMSVEPYHRDSGVHVLDFSRKIMTSKSFTGLHGTDQVYGFVGRSASELIDAGATFVASKEKHITFSNGVLSLPHLSFGAFTEHLLLNAIAYEKLHPTAIGEVSSYVSFMHGLIQSPTDVHILRSHNLIDRPMISDEAVVSLIDKIADGVLLDPDCNLHEVTHLLHEYYTHKMNNLRLQALKMMRHWKKMYSSNPWMTVLHFIAFLVSVQTVYIVLRFYR